MTRQAVIGFQTAHGLESQFSPTTVDSLTGKMGAIVHPTGGLNSRDLRTFHADNVCAAIQCALQFVFIVHFTERIQVQRASVIQQMAKGSIVQRGKDQ